MSLHDKHLMVNSTYRYKLLHDVADVLFLWVFCVPTSVRVRVSFLQFNLNHLQCCSSLWSCWPPGE